LSFSVQYVLEAGIQRPLMTNKEKIGLGIPHNKELQNFNVSRNIIRILVKDKMDITCR
jgi:hypothetical protein